MTTDDSPHGDRARVMTRRAALLAPATLAIAACDAPGTDEYAARTASLRAALAATPALPELVRYATLAANGHNTQPWRFRVRAGGLRVLPDFTRRTPVVDPDDHHLYVSLGCTVENLLIAAAARGQAGAAAPSADGVDIDLVPAAAREDDLFAAIPQRQSTRSVYDGRAVPAAALGELEAAARFDGVSLRLVTDRGQLGQVLDFVIAGNSAQMDDPAFVAELLRWIRFSPAEALATGDGLYAASSGNPTLPGWLGRRLFPLVFRKAAENDRYATQLRSSAGVAIFTGDRAEPDHWIRVGQAFQRFALKATALGLRHAHVNQPVEVPAVRQDLARWLGAPEARPDLVVRFGYAPPMPMSLRRPVDAVLEG
jgi:nitroreductase